MKDAYQVDQVTSRERGDLITMIGIICANGNALTPMLVFPMQKRFMVHLMELMVWHV